MNIGKFSNTEIGSTCNYTILVTEKTAKGSTKDKPVDNC